MAARLNISPKRYGEAVCDCCSSVFPKTGLNNKRCAACRIEHKRKYERENKRASHARRAKCEDCGNPFPSDIHASTIRCAPCAKAARSKQAAKRNLERHHRRWKQDAGHRVHMSMSVLIRRALRKTKNGRSWEALVGYDLSALRQHLERQFLSGMSWDNFGRWHIDHIIPRSSFCFTDVGDSEFRACWALTNLRPLWAADNRRKSAKRLHLI